MQVNHKDKQNFGTVISHGYVLNRLNSFKRVEQYGKLIVSQDSNPVDILLMVDKNGRMSAKFRSEHFSDLPEIKENYFRAKFNMDPVKFVKKLCNIANQLKKDEQEIYKY